MKDLKFFTKKKTDHYIDCAIALFGSSYNFINYKNQRCYFELSKDDKKRIRERFLKLLDQNGNRHYDFLNSVTSGENYLILNRVKKKMPNEHEYLLQDTIHWNKKNTAI